MGDGLKRAFLATLLTRAPWMGDKDGDPWTLTAEELRGYYEALCRGAEHPNRALGAQGHSGGRKADRANALLKRAGLVRFDRPTRKWVAT